MAQDSLSVAAVELPGSSFDPVQWSKQRRSEFLQDQADRRTRYNELMGELKSTPTINPVIHSQLIKERNDLYNEGATKMSEGIDITDVTNPKYGIDAAGYRTRMGELNSKITKGLLYEDLANKAEKYIADDVAKHGESGIFDIAETRKNIDYIKNAKSIEEIDRFLASKGDNLLVTRFQPADVGKLVSGELDDIGTNTVSDTKIVGGKEVSTSYTEKDPEQVKKKMYGLWQRNPNNLQETIKRERDEDPTKIPGESLTDYFYRMHGTPLLRQKMSTSTKPYKADKVNEPEKKEYQQSAEPVETLMGNMKVKGRNVYTFNQSKPLNVTFTENAVNLSTGGKLVDANTKKPVKGAVSFTPINTAEYYVLTTAKAGFPKGTIITDTDIERGTRFKPGDYEAKRFVEGTYPVAKGNKTVLVPYEDIKNELDAKFKMANDIPEPSSYSPEENNAIEAYAKRKGLSRKDAEQAYEDYKKQGK